MAVYNILPTTNLKWDDIRDTLNAGGGTVTNVVSTAFSVSAKINRWSKYKPVAYPQNFTDNYPDWYKGGKGDCGLNLITSGNIRDSINAGCWEYVLPKGGASEPYRIGDFRGYNTKAVPFLKSQYSKGMILTAIEKSALPIIYTLENNNGSLSLSDFNKSQSIEFDNVAMFVEVWDMAYTKLELQQNGYDPITAGNNTLEFNPAGLNFGYHKILFGLKSLDSGRILSIPYSDENYYEFDLYYRNLASMLAQYNLYSIYAGSNTSLFYDNNVAKDVLKVTSSNNFTIKFKISVPDGGATFTVPEYININTNYTLARELFTRQESQSTVSPGSEKQFTYTGLIRDLELGSSPKKIMLNIYLQSGEQVGTGYVDMSL